MNDLIEALTIFLKYGDPKFPLHCEHDVLTVMIGSALVSAKDTARLAELSFTPERGERGGYFTSYRFGSA